MAQRNLTKTFSKWFGWGVKSSKNNGQSSPPYPTNINKETPIELPDRIQELYDYFIQLTHIDDVRLQDRLKRYQELRNMFMGHGTIAKSAVVTVNELLNSNPYSLPIQVEAKTSLRKKIETFWQDIGLYEELNAITTNVVRYGDGGIILSYNEDNAGISSIQSISPFQLTERVEFTPLQIAADLKNHSSLVYRITRRNIQMRDFMKAIQEDKDYAKSLEPRLFGFLVEDQVMAPWRFIHFRRETDDNIFYPYGWPTYMFQLGPYLKWDALWNLQTIARGTNFPIDHYTLKGFGQGGDPVSRSDRAWELMRKLQNLGMLYSKKEKVAIGEKRVSIENTFEWQKEEPGMRLSDIDDIDLASEDIWRSLITPRGYIDPTNGAFGASGVALTQQFKPFAYEAREIQKCIMKGVKLLTDIHLTLQGENIEELDYLITMPFPSAQEDRDQIGSMSDLLRLANDYIAALRDNFGGNMGDAIPADLVRMIYKKFLPFDAEWIEKAIDEYLKGKEEMQIEFPEGGGLNESSRLVEVVRKKKTLRKFTEKQYLETINTAEIKVLMEHVRGTLALNNKLYYSSRNRNKDFDPSFWVRNYNRKLNEKDLTNKETISNLDFRFTLPEKDNEEEI